VELVKSDGRLCAQVLGIGQRTKASQRRSPPTQSISKTTFIRRILNLNHFDIFNNL
jgi:hypothetical protein